MAEDLTVVGLGGSMRVGSTSLTALRTALEGAGAAGVRTMVLDLREAAVAGHFSLDAAASPAHTQLLDAVTTPGDVVLVAVPNVTCVEAADPVRGTLIKCAWATFSAFGVVEAAAPLTPNQVAVVAGRTLPRSPVAAASCGWVG